MEFVDKGCLRSFLNNFKRTVPPDSYKRKTDFLLYGKQIAEGMHYLVSFFSFSWPHNFNWLKLLFVKIMSSKNL